MPATAATATANTTAAAAAQPACASGLAPGRLQGLRNSPRRPGEAADFFYGAQPRHMAVKVLAGAFYVTDEDLGLLTTPGSCIAACGWDSKKRMGSMKHFVLPGSRQWCMSVNAAACAAVAVRTSSNNAVWWSAGNG